MTSANTTISCEDPTLLDSVAVKATKTAAYSVLLLLSLVGNSVVPAVVYRNPELHTSVNYFIASMSISDLLMPIFAFTERIKQVFIPQDIWQIDGSFGSLLCKLRAFATDTSIIVTVLTLVIVSLERFFAVKYPFKTQPLRRRKSCFVVIALSWMLAMTYSSSNLYAWRITILNGTTQCTHSWKPAFDSAEAYTIEKILFVVLFFIIPLVILVVIYSIIIVYFHRKKTPGQLEERQWREKTNMHRRITYMLLTVVVFFFIPATSQTVYVFLSIFVWTGDQPCNVGHLGFALTYTSYMWQAFNPYIYCMFNKRYTEGFKKILCCATKCNYCMKTKAETQEQTLIQNRGHRFARNKNSTSITEVKTTVLMISSV